jgi:hypothetical protein
VQVVVAGAGFVLDGYDLMRTVAGELGLEFGPGASLAAVVSGWPGSPAALAADEVLAHAVS